MNRNVFKSFFVLLCLCLAIAPFTLTNAESQGQDLNDGDKLILDDELTGNEEIELDDENILPDEFPDAIELYYEDFESEEELEAEVTKLLHDESVSGVQVISKKETIVSPLAVRLPGVWYTHGNSRIQFLKRSNTYGPVIHSNASDPGITMNMNDTIDYAAAYSGDFGLNPLIISMTVGFNVTDSYTVSYSGSYTVPEKVNNKEVDNVQLNSKLVYQTDSYTVVSPEYPTGKTGIAKKPVGIYYQKQITYK
ncbi:hypothetical protein [Oceanobacillus sojae]|uniref:hypothetical protein n=1 Tax=Oceanobacillus sojae TaxID=582851 RepID=UPI0009882F35|nr:hypothetical protein [Oceanobacillus sojae]